MNELSPSGPESAAIPYKFLDYFEESEQDRFAGREDEIQEALVGVTRGRTYVVYGPSGVGKTSLLLAGLFPRWRQRGFHPLRVRVFKSPVVDLCTALAAELQRPELGRELDAPGRLELVTRVLTEVSAREPLLIVLDQFEEFFVLFREQSVERNGFLELLGRVSRECVNVRLVFSLREDYFVQLADLRSFLPELTEHGLRLRPLTAYGARQAIVRPLQDVGARYDEAFVKRLVDLLACWRFDPPVLQIVCTELYREIAGRRGLPVHLTRRDLEQLGGVDGLMRTYVLRTTAGLAAERLLLVRVVLDALISSEHIRRTLRAEDLLAGAARARLEEIHAVLEHLAGRRLLRVEYSEGERWYELLNERLVPILEDWLDTDADFMRFRRARHFVATMGEDPRWRTDPAWLLTEAQVVERVDPWKQWLRLDEAETELLLRSSIHWRTDGIAYWAARLDELHPGRSTELVLGLLEHPALSVRLGAASSCGRLRDASGRLARRCLELALESPDEELRRAAGGSFVRLAGPEELARLREALESRALRKRALELLADLEDAGHPLESLPGPWRLRARRLLQKRFQQHNRELLRHRTIHGARTGVAMALLWSVTLCLVHLHARYLYLDPASVTWAWSRPRDLLSSMLFSLFVLDLIFGPLGALTGWGVGRRATLLQVRTGRESWGAPVLHSFLLFVSCLLFSFVAWFYFLGTPGLVEAQDEVAKWLGLRGIWSLLPLMLLLAAVLTALLTAGVVSLCRRCIPPGSRASTLYFWAFMSALVLPLLVETLVNWFLMPLYGLSPPLFVVIRTLVAMASGISSFQSLIVVCSLATWPERQEKAPAVRGHVAWARGMVLLAAAVLATLYGIYFGPDTIPSFQQRQLDGELVLEGRIWPPRDVDYFTLIPPPGGPVVLSVHPVDSPATRLILDGQEMSSEALLVSTRSRIVAAVALPPVPGSLPEAPGPGAVRIPYRYLLRGEPFSLGMPQTLSEARWTISAFPLEPVVEEGDASPHWRVRLEGWLPPGQRRAHRGVLLHPVLIDIPQLEQSACLGIFSTPEGEEYAQTAVRINREGSAFVPAPGSQAGFFSDDFRLEPREDGHWSLTLSVSELRESRPVQCGTPLERLQLLETGGAQPGPYGPNPTLMVALRLY